MLALKLSETHHEFRIVQDNSRSVKYFKNSTELAVEQFDWLILVISPLNYISCVIMDLSISLS